MKVSPNVVRHPKHKKFQLAEGSITAPDAFQVLCGHEFQMKNCAPVEDLSKMASPWLDGAAELAVQDPNGKSQINPFLN